MEREQRSNLGAELRLDKREGEPDRIVGYAALFNVRSNNLGGFFEVIAPGAFDRALREGDDVRALWQHEDRDVLGRSTSGTLKLSIDQRGLLVEIEPPDTERVRDHLELIRRGDVSQMSFAFSTLPGDTEWAEEKDGTILRTVKGVARLWDVSVVTFPAYEETGVAVRELRAWKDEHANASQASDSSTGLPLSLAQARQRQIELGSRIVV